MKENSLIIVTHNDRFHADDVFATATLKILFGDKIKEIIRTRDDEIISKADIVFDVGHIYDPELNRFDHHQTSGAGNRLNGIPYAAFGLVWKKFGLEICGSQEVSLMIDKKIVQVIDAKDNGFAIYDYDIDDIQEYVLDNVCHSFGPTWKEDDDFDKPFFEMVDIAEKILRREIKVAKDKYDAMPIVEKIYEDTEDKRLIVLDSYYPWGDVISKYEDVLFVIYPSKDKTQWRLNTVQNILKENRKSLPAKWGGLRDSDLENITGVIGSRFCHKALFLAVTNTKEQAIELAKMAIES